MIVALHQDHAKVYFIKITYINSELKHAKTKLEYTEQTTVSIFRYLNML